MEEKLKCVIIIPYRDRENHIKEFLESSLPKFREHLGSFRVVVVEQEEGKLFNRGRLINIGFSLYRDKTAAFFPHDVDMLPSEECVKSLYTLDTHDAIRITVPHDRSLGRVCKLKHDAVFASNGHPNELWGWGIEDRALFNRFRIMHCSISQRFTRTPACKFRALRHRSNFERYSGEKKRVSDYEQHILRCGDRALQEKHIFSSGLNNLEYTVIDRSSPQDDVDWIKVSI